MNAQAPLDINPPAYLTPEQRVTYMEVIRRSHKEVMCQSDGPIVEFVAVTLELCRRTNWEINTNRLGKFLTALERLGMTPASRSKVALARREDAKKKDDPLKEFAA